MSEEDLSFKEINQTETKKNRRKNLKAKENTPDEDKACVKRTNIKAKNTRKWRRKLSFEESDSDYSLKKSKISKDNLEVSSKNKIKESNIFQSKNKALDDLKLEAEENTQAKRRSQRNLKNKNSKDTNLSYGCPTTQDNSENYMIPNSELQSVTPFMPVDLKWNISPFSAVLSSQSPKKRDEKLNSKLMTPSTWCSPFDFHI